MTRPRHFFVVDVHLFDRKIRRTALLRRPRNRTTPTGADLFELLLEELDEFLERGRRVHYPRPGGKVERADGYGLSVVLASLYGSTVGDPIDNKDHVLGDLCRGLGETLKTRPLLDTTLVRGKRATNARDVKLGGVWIVFGDYAIGASGRGCGDSGATTVAHFSGRWGGRGGGAGRSVDVGDVRHT